MDELTSTGAEGPAAGATITPIRTTAARKPRPIHRVTVIECESTYPDFTSPTAMPRTYGITVIGSIIRNLGKDVKVYLEVIAPIDMDRVKDSDLICFGSLAGAANKTFALADHIRQLRPDIPMVYGGTFASYFSELCLEHVDYVIRNEGDETIVELIQALEQGGDVSAIRGLSYRAPDGAPVHVPAREVVKDFDIINDYSLIEGFADLPQSQLQMLVRQRRIKWIVLQYSRGCPFTCNFCISPVMFGRGYRMRSIDGMIADIKNKLQYGDYFIFSDNYFTANKKYCKKLLRRMIAEKVGGTYSAFTRCEATSDRELMDLLREAGFDFLFMGAESLNDEILLSLNKQQTAEKIARGVDNIRDAGMKCSATFQCGNDFDKPGDIAKCVDFGFEHDIAGVYFISAWSWPEVSKPTMDKQRMIIRSLDHINGHFVCHFPMNMKPSTLQQEIVDQQRRFWSPKRLPKLLAEGKFDRAAHLVTQWYALSHFDKHLVEHIDYLKSIEAPYYDAEERLRLDVIERRNLGRWNEDFNERYVGRLVGSYTGAEASQLREAGPWAA
jgi:hypothetical protein